MVSYLREDAVLVARDFTTLHRFPYTVVAPFHQPSLQPDGVAQVAIIFDITTTSLPVRQAFKLRVEVRIIALCQEQQQAQSGDLVPLCGVWGKNGCGQLVEGLELLYVASEGVRVAGADSEEGALLVGLAGEGEEIAWSGRGWCEGVELEEGELCFGEKGVCVGVGHGGGVFELAQNLGECAFGHGEGGWAVSDGGCGLKIWFAKGLGSWRSRWDVVMAGW